VTPPPARRSAPAAAALRWGPALAWAAVIFVLSSFSRLPSPPGNDKTHHLVAYAVLGAALVWGLTDRAPRRTTWGIALAAVLLASAYGASDEFHQGFVPGREVSALDWVADTAGAAIAAAGLRAAVIIRARR
jgi:VanZ family protein